MRLWHGSSEGGDDDRQQLCAFLAGLERYWTAPRTVATQPAELVWSCGTTRLLGYGPTAGPPVLIVPSLINRAHVLDLGTDRSLIRFLADAGHRVLLLDWGWPGAAERRLDLDDYIVGRLERAMHAYADVDRRRLVLLGYCMGGVLAAAAAARCPRRIRGLALLATPWDFHASLRASPALQALARAPDEALLTAGAVPVDVLQTLFASLDPEQVPRKFARFGRLEPGGAEAATFVAIEDWVNDGVPLAPAVARTCLKTWYADNAPARGRWQVAGRCIRPERIRTPAFVAIPDHDRIVPPEAALPLARALPRAEIVRPPCGHITMVVGKRARLQLWQPLLAWLNTLGALQKTP